MNTLEKDLIEAGMKAIMEAATHFSQVENNKTMQAVVPLLQALSGIVETFL